MERIKKSKSIFVMLKLVKKLGFEIIQ